MVAVAEFVTIFCFAEDRQLGTADAAMVSIRFYLHLILSLLFNIKAVICVDCLSKPFSIVLNEL